MKTSDPIGDFKAAAKVAADPVYKLLYTGSVNTPKKVYDAAMDEGGLYLLQHSPVRGAYGFVGVAGHKDKNIKNHEITIHAEGLLLGGFDMDDGAWSAYLLGGGVEAGPATVVGGVEGHLDGHHPEGIVLVEPSESLKHKLPQGLRLPVGAYFTKEGLGVYVYKGKQISKHTEAVIGGGVDFKYKTLGNLISPDYYMGRLPIMKP